MSKHTKGPWFVVDHPASWTIQNKEGGAGECVAQSYGDSGKANAHLIAAAPQLYEAVMLFLNCRHSVNMGDPIAEAISKGLIAIAKAEGGQ